MPPVRRDLPRQGARLPSRPQNKRAAPGSEPSSASDTSTAETSPVTVAADAPDVASSEAATAAADSREPAASKVDEAASSDAPAQLSSQLPSAGAAVVSKPAAAWTPLQSFSPLQSAPSVRVPFGYVPGAISVEMPKRQRSAKANPNFPRSFSSLV